MRVAVKHHGVVRHHEDTARRQLKEYEGTIGGQVIFLRILDMSEIARYMKEHVPCISSCFRQVQNS